MQPEKAWKNQGFTKWCSNAYNYSKKVILSISKTLQKNMVKSSRIKVLTTRPTLYTVRKDIKRAKRFWSNYHI